MARFLSTDLTHRIDKNDVVFTVNARILFQKHEVDTKWHLSMKFKEKDRLKDDKLLSTSRTVKPTQTEVEVSFSEPIPIKVVNTEIGKEEVFVNLHIVPMEEPPPFIEDSAKTNIQKVDV